MKEIFDKISADCSRITTQRYSTSFTWGIYLLSKDLRPHIYAIYGFVRFADEIVDTFHEYDKKYLLDKFKKDCFEAIAFGISLNPVLNSFQKVVNDFGIDHELIELFLNSMEMDLQPEMYSKEKYEKYILGSAEVVGLMCLYVFVNGNKEQYESLKPFAMKLGSTFQKVNFLRDVKADFQQLNRNYFPNVNLENFSDYQKFEIEKEIEEEFRVALIGIKQLPISSRKGVYLAYIYYKKLFDKIKNVNAKQIMNKRIRISNGRKIGLMLDSIFRYKMNFL
ncbi:MAG: phytoene/squalene synthase family protein [Sphingobacteriaceae bacterium]|jgi:phytoene/squalene synthetase|nr:phytoene/squalene synthase family protein [Sphingobacteriaceae bacterium]